MKTTTTKIEERIAELEATPRALIGCDEGTHGKPLNHRIYEEITGERYAVASFGGNNGTRCTVEEAQEATCGRIRMFPEAVKEMAALRRKLAELRNELRRQ